MASRRGGRRTRRVLAGAITTGVVTAGLTGPFAGSAGAVTPTAGLLGSDVELIAHRGGNNWGPESTMAAYKHAIGSGADAIEFDVRFTQDGHKIVMHDETLNRTTDCTGLVSRTTLEQINRCDAGSWFGPQFRGEGVPSMNQVMRLAANNGVNAYVHLKDVSTPHQARDIMKAIRNNGMDNRHTTIFAGSERMLQLMKDAGAKRLGLLFARSAEWDSDWDVLIPYNMIPSSARIAKAHERGQDVVAVQGNPLSVVEFLTFGLDGYMADNVDSALLGIGRLLTGAERREVITGRLRDGGDHGSTADNDGGDRRRGRHCDIGDPDAEFDQELRGTSGDDVICGGDGDDVIRGRGGDDIILGGKGDDELRGGRGQDEIRGYWGEDDLLGGKSRDELRGGGGRDDLRGGKSRDELHGGGKDDELRGQTGRDRLRDDSGRDYLNGGAQSDSCRGGSGDDRYTRC